MCSRATLRRTIPINDSVRVRQLAGKRRCSLLRREPVNMVAAIPQRAGSFIPTRSAPVVARSRLLCRAISNNATPSNKDQDSLQNRVPAASPVPALQQFKPHNQPSRSPDASPIPNPTTPGSQPLPDLDPTNLEHTSLVFDYVNSPEYRPSLVSILADRLRDDTAAGRQFIFDAVSSNSAPVDLIISVIMQPQTQNESCMAPAAIKHAMPGPPDTPRYKAVDVLVGVCSNAELAPLVCYDRVGKALMSVLEGEVFCGDAKDAALLALWRLLQHEDASVRQQIANGAGGPQVVVKHLVATISSAEHGPPMSPPWTLEQALAAAPLLSTWLIWPCSLDAPAELFHIDHNPNLVPAIVSLLDRASSFSSDGIVTAACRALHVLSSSSFRVTTPAVLSKTPTSEAIVSDRITIAGIQRTLPPCLPPPQTFSVPFAAAVADHFVKQMVDAKAVKALATVAMLNSSTAAGAVALRCLQRMVASDTNNLHAESITAAAGGAMQLGIVLSHDDDGAPAADTAQQTRSMLADYLQQLTIEARQVSHWRAEADHLHKFYRSKAAVLLQILRATYFLYFIIVVFLTLIIPFAAAQTASAGLIWAAQALLATWAVTTVLLTTIREVKEAIGAYMINGPGWAVLGSAAACGIFRAVYGLAEAASWPSSGWLAGCVVTYTILYASIYLPEPAECTCLRAIAIFLLFPVAAAFDCSANPWLAGISIIGSIAIAAVGGAVLKGLAALDNWA